MRTPKPVEPKQGRSFDRLINFTDAITAVAITVLVLPIVDLRAQGGEQTVWAIMSDNAGQLTSFTLTFLVVAAMWQVHNRIFSRLIGFDDTIFWLNLLWLILIVLVPWSSSLYGAGIDATSGAETTWFSGGVGLGGAGLFYWSNLAAISAVSNLIAWHARRNPILIDTQAPTIFRSNAIVRWRGFIFAAYMLLVGITSMVIPSFAVWMPFGIFIVGYVLKRQES